MHNYRFLIAAPWLAAALALAAPLAAAAGATDAKPLYRSAGKSLAPVTLRSDGEYKGIVGIPLPLPLEFRTGTDAEAVRIEIAAGDGVALDSAPRRESLGRVAAGDFHLPALTVTPLRAGRHYIIVNVFMQFEASTRFRSFTIPVQVGPQAAHKRVTTVSGPDGRPLHLLPAREIP